MRQDLMIMNDRFYATPDSMEMQKWPVLRNNGTDRSVPNDRTIGGRISIGAVLYRS